MDSKLHDEKPSEANEEFVAFLPTADFVLLKPIIRNQTEGGLALPDGADPNPQKAKVLKVGPGRTTDFGAFIEPTVEPGEVYYLYFAYDQPIPIKLDGQDYLICRERALVGKVPSNRPRICPASVDDVPDLDYGRDLAVEFSRAA